MRILTIAVLGLGAVGCATTSNIDTVQSSPPQPPALSAMLDREAASRGRAIALVGCASCHAIDRTGPSTHRTALPFRDIVRRRSLDEVEADMAQGLVTTHPDMPPYVFRAGEIDDLRAYMETLRGERRR